MRSYVIYVSVLCLAVGGCGNSMPQRIADTTSSTLKDTRVVITSVCPISKGTAEAFPLIAAGIVSAVLPKVIDKGIDLTAKFLKDWHESYGATTSGRAATYMYLKGANDNLNVNVGCISVVRGTFGAETPGKSLPEGSFWASTGKVVMENHHLVEAPDLYLESSVEYSPDRKAFRLKPRFMSFLNTAAKRTRGWGAGKKTINVLFNFETPSKGANEGQSFGAANFVFNDVPLGSWYDDKALAHKGEPALTTQWIPTLPVADAEFTQLEKNSKFMPITIKVTIQEGEDMGDVLLKSSEVLSESKSKLSEELAKAIEKSLGIQEEQKK